MGVALLVLVLALTVVTLLVAWRARVVVPGGQVAVIGRSGAGRVVMGPATTWALPMVDPVCRLGLAPRTVQLRLHGAPSRDGIPVDGEGAATTRVDPNGLARVAARFAGRSTVDDAIRGSIERALQEVLADWTAEEIDADAVALHDALSARVIDVLAADGLLLESLEPMRLSDASGVLEAMRRRRTAQADLARALAEEQSADEVTQTMDDMSGRLREFFRRAAETDAEVARARRRASTDDR